MAEYFNQHQVMERLGIKDYRTLKRWCQETSPAIEPRTREGYGPGPSLWYTGTQLRKLEKVAEAHSRSVRRSGSEEELTGEESTHGALLDGKESRGEESEPSFATRLKTLEARMDTLGLTAGETLASLIQQEVKRQLQGRTRVAKVTMQSSSEGRDALTGSAE
jgi:hypothetical protein